MFLRLFDFVSSSLNPSGPSGPLVGTANSPGLPGPTVEPVYRTVIDNTATNAAAVGKVLVRSTTATNLYGATYAQSSVPQQPLQKWGFGVVVFGQNPSIGAQPLASATLSTTGLQSNIVVEGPCNALCTTPTGTAIAVGSYLTTDGNGNLAPLAPPSAAPTPTVTPVGTAGTTNYSYALVAVSADGIPTAVGTAGASTTSNAALSNTNYNQITWAPVADAAQYIVIRTVAAGTPNTLGVVGIVPAGTAVFNDTGLAVLAGTSATQAFSRLSANTPTVTPTGTTGATNYSYKITAILPNGVWSAEGTAGSTTTGNATLSATNYNAVTWTASTGAVLYAVDRTVGGATQGFIGFTTGVAFNDTGIVATAFPAAQVVPNPTPRPGIVAAVSLGTLAAATSTPTSVPVIVGGFQ